MKILYYTLFIILLCCLIYTQNKCTTTVTTCGSMNTRCNTHYNSPIPYCGNIACPRGNLSSSDRKDFIINVYDKMALDFTPKTYAKFRNAWYNNVELANQMEQQYPILAYIYYMVRKAYSEICLEQIPPNQVKIWYMYNMGFVIKTQDVCFGIDLVTRDANTLVDTLDFAIVSHKHEDHFQPCFVDAMRQAGKPVYAPFYFQSLSTFNTRKKIHLSIKNTVVDLDFTLSAQIAEQNLLSQITINNTFTLLHIGDNTRIDFINPTRHVNVFMLDGRLQPPLRKSTSSSPSPINSHYAPVGLLTSLDAINRVKADYTLLGHMLELGHSNIVDQAPNRAWGFQIYKTLEDTVNTSSSITPLIPGDVFDLSL